MAFEHVADLNQFLTGNDLTIHGRDGRHEVAAQIPEILEIIGVGDPQPWTPDDSRFIQTVEHRLANVFQSRLASSVGATGQPVKKALHAGYQN